MKVTRTNNSDSDGFEFQITSVPAKSGKVTIVSLADPVNPRVIESGGFKLLPGSYQLVLQMQHQTEGMRIEVRNDGTVQTTDLTADEITRVLLLVPEPSGSEGMVFEPSPGSADSTLDQFQALPEGDPFEPSGFGAVPDVGAGWDDNDWGDVSDPFGPLSSDPAPSPLIADQLPHTTDFAEAKAEAIRQPSDSAESLAAALRGERVVVPPAPETVLPPAPPKRPGFAALDTGTLRQKHRDVVYGHKQVVDDLVGILKSLTEPADRPNSVTETSTMLFETLDSLGKVLIHEQDWASTVPAYIKAVQDKAMAYRAEMFEERQEAAKRIEALLAELNDAQSRLEAAETQARAADERAAAAEERVARAEALVQELREKITTAQEQTAKLQQANEELTRLVSELKTKQKEASVMSDDSIELEGGMTPPQRSAPVQRVELVIRVEGGTAAVALPMMSSAPKRSRTWPSWIIKRALPAVVVLFLTFFALLKLGEGIQSETIRGSIASVNEWLSQETPLDYKPAAVNVSQDGTSSADSAQLAALREELDSLRKRAGQAEADVANTASRVRELEQQLAEAQSREAALTAERDQLRRALSGATRIRAVNGQIALPQGLAPANATQWSGSVGGRQLTAVPISQSHSIGDSRGLAVLYFFGGTGNQQFLGQAIALIE